MADSGIARNKCAAPPARTLFGLDLMEFVAPRRPA
jgi:hypothetical protein